MVLENKNKEQLKAVNNWINHNSIGTIIAGSGFGKSRVAILAIDWLRKNTDRILILVPANVGLQTHFINEFDKWNVSIKNVEVIDYENAYKLKNQHYDIVICDEIHIGILDKYRNFFKNNTWNKLLCMTANKEDIKHKEVLFSIAPIVYTISLDECVELGIINKHETNCQQG